MKCHAAVCQAACEHPIYRPGECCPTCPRKFLKRKLHGIMETEMRIKHLKARLNKSISFLQQKSFEMKRKFALRLTVEVESVPEGICWMCVVVLLVSAMSVRLSTVAWIVLSASNWIHTVVLNVHVSKGEALEERINRKRSTNVEQVTLATAAALHWVESLG